MYTYAKPKDKHAKKDAVQKNDSVKPVASPNLTGIPDTMKTRFENLSGFSFDDVRVHYNSDKPAQLQALAYTQGNQVYVSPGQEKHLGHELGHVVQQKQGRVHATGVLGGKPINTDAALEHDADKFISRAAAPAHTNSIGSVPPSISLVQRAADEEKEEATESEAKQEIAGYLKAEDEKALAVDANIEALLDETVGLIDGAIKKVQECAEYSQTAEKDAIRAEKPIQGLWLIPVWGLAVVSAAFLINSLLDLYNDRNAHHKKITRTCAVIFDGLGTFSSLITGLIAYAKTDENVKKRWEAAGFLSVIFLQFSRVVTRICLARDEYKRSHFGDPIVPEDTGRLSKKERKKLLDTLEKRQKKLSAEYDEIQKLLRGNEERSQKITGQLAKLGVGDQDLP